MKHTLLVRPKFGRGDGSNGYMLKLAAANGLKVSNFRSMGVSFGTELANEGLCSLDGEPYLKELHSLALRLATAKYTDSRRYCPECLAEGNCADILCEVAFCTSCPRHGIEQRTECHECGDRITWTYGTSTHCTCGSDLRLHPTIPASGSSVLTAGVVKQAAMAGRASHGVFENLTLDEWLALLDFLAKCSLRTLGDLKSGSARVFEDDAIQAKKSAAAAAEALADWPVTFLSRLEELQSGPASADAARLTKVFGPLYRHIYCNLEAETFAPVRREFESYVAKHWWSGLSRRNSRLASSSTPGLEAQWLSVMEVRRQLKLGRPAVRWLMDRGILESRMDVRGGRSFAYASKSSVEAYQTYMANTLRPDEAVQILGLGPNRTKELVAALDVAQFPFAEETGFAEPRVSRSVVDDLLELMRTAPIAKQGMEGVVALGTVLRAWRLSSLELTTLLSKIRQREFKVLRRVSNARPGLSALLLNYEDVASIRPAHRDPDQLTVREVAAELKVKDSVVYHLIRIGLINAQDSKERFKRFVIKEKSLQAFKTRYVTGPTVARQYAVSSIFLRRYLASFGIKPRCSADTDSSHVMIFRNDAAFQGAMRRLGTKSISDATFSQVIPPQAATHRQALRLVSP